jgi:CheY-like chemotaxis protein
VENNDRRLILVVDDDSDKALSPELRLPNSGYVVDTYTDPLGMANHL